MKGRSLCFATVALLASLVLISGCSKTDARQSKTLFVWDRPIAVAHLPIAKSTTCRIKKSLAVSYSKKITNEELEILPKGSTTTLGTKMKLTPWRLSTWIRNRRRFSRTEDRPPSQ